MAAPQSLTRPVGLWPGNHVAWAVDDPGEVAGLLDAYFREGVARGERLIHVPAAGGRHTADALAAIPDAEDLADRGQLRVESAEEVYAPLGSGDVWSQARRFEHEAAAAVADGFTGLRVWADVTALIGDATTRQLFLDYELAVEQTFRRAPATGLCALDVTAAGEEWARFACRHRFRRERDETPRVSVDLHDDVIRLVGEVDVACVRELRDALTSARRTVTGPVVVDLEGLDFLDVSGTRTLAQFVAEQEASGSVVELVGAGAVVRRLLSLFGLREGTSS